MRQFSMLTMELHQALSSYPTKTMASALLGSLKKRINSCKILVVGAGGIGCELLKNLVLTGFHDIELIDLDTIDVSNLNRQFLFRKEHVGKSKAMVARESALKLNPNANITAYHDDIMRPVYGLDFFKRFTLVMGALDNRATRKHVNRLCLAADVPLIDGGTAGYLGQVTVIKKGMTECYECRPNPAQDTFPGCTIRNTPTEFIHCVVWAKHLFNQLYGEEDPDQDVSPDTEDPEAAGDSGTTQSISEVAYQHNASNTERKSTRHLAQENGYNTRKIFNKLFRDDISYLLSMKNLWKKWRPPTPLDYDNLDQSTTGNDEGLMDHRVWGVRECADTFSQAVNSLKDKLIRQSWGGGGMLVWDKDDDEAMNFVTSAANIRAHIFGIPLKSRFDIKSMAGNIIPAIATTNAIIAALIVMEAMKILNGQIDQCKIVYLNRKPNFRKKLLVPCTLDPPNPRCCVCSEKSQTSLHLGTENFFLDHLEDEVSKLGLVKLSKGEKRDDGIGTILISSDEDEVEDDVSLSTGSQQQHDYIKGDKLDEGQEFDVIGEITDPASKVCSRQNDRPAAASPEGKFSNIDDVVDMVTGHSSEVSAKRKMGVNEFESAMKKPRFYSVEDVDEFS